MNLSWIEKVVIILFIPFLVCVKHLYYKLNEGMYIDWSGVVIVLFSSGVGIGLSVLLKLCLG